MSDAEHRADAAAHPLPGDATLGGYLRVHDRPPAYEGSDGHPYTVSIEVERTADLRGPYAGYLVFPRWARTGVGIVGHVETRTLAQGSTREETSERLEGMSLLEVREALEEAIRGRAAADRDEADDDTRPGGPQGAGS